MRYPLAGATFPPAPRGRWPGRIRQTAGEVGNPRLAQDPRASSCLVSRFFYQCAETRRSAGVCCRALGLQTRKVEDQYAAYEGLGHTVTRQVCSAIRGSQRGHSLLDVIVSCNTLLSGEINVSKQNFDNVQATTNSLLDCRYAGQSRRSAACRK